MKKRLIITVASILAIGALAFASPMNFKGCQNKGPMDQTMLVEKLNLTDAQKKEIATIRQTNMETRQAMMGQNRVRFSSYLSASGFDKAKFIKDKLAQEEMKTSRMADNFEKIYNVLTPAQKDEFIKLMKDRESNMQKMMQKNSSNNKSMMQNCCNSNNKKMPPM
jgi:Spy/CpxP family protein refolding chaperone